MFKRAIRFNILAFIFILIAACATGSKYSTEQKAEFESAIIQLNTPEKVNSWLCRNFVYDWEILRYNSNKSWSSFHDFWVRGIKYPINTYYDRGGVCIDSANLAGYALHTAGYKVKIVTGLKYPGARGVNQHTVCAFQRHEKWWACGDTRYSFKCSIAGPFDNIKEVADHAVGGKSCLYNFMNRKGF